jgi:hypothetical protein
MLQSEEAEESKEIPCLFRKLNIVKADIEEYLEGNK